MSIMLKADLPPVRICDSCPFLACNHSKRHPSSWYTIVNIKRLWNGLRTAKSPGMICHSSDPFSSAYGSTKTVHPDSQLRECAGALILITKHCNEATKEFTETGDTKEYRTRHKFPLTKRGLHQWMTLYLFKSLRAVEDYRTNEVVLPKSLE